jgi:hypothetical protein
MYHRMAEALLDPASRTQYMLHRMASRDEAWERITPAVLIALGKTFGVQTVITAVSFVYETDVEVRNPIAYLRTVCLTIAREGEP